MKITNQQTSPIDAKYNITASTEELAKHKEAVINKFKSSVKVPGFRPGKAPSEMVEKYIDPMELQNDVLNEIVNELYLASTKQLELRVVNEPQLNILKFVPFSTLEFSVNVDIITNVSLADYSKFDIKLESLPVNKEELDNTIRELRLRSATFNDVDRAAKLDDQVTIDFKGSDFKTKESLNQASGSDYKLLLGSKQFVPGFEEKMVGKKAGDTTTFSLTFPKDYHDDSFKSRKITFEVTIKTVSSVELPKLNAEFAAKLGPFKTIKELEDELKKQLQVENDRQANRQYEDKILNKLAETTKVELPQSLIDNEVSKLEAEAKQGALNKGQSWPEFLASIDTDEEGYLNQLTPLAELRIRGGLAIGEIARNEHIDITQNELDTQISQLKEQYKDAEMQAELDQPNNRREILMRMLSEKVLLHIKDKLSSSSSTAAKTKPKSTKK